MNSRLTAIHDTRLTETSVEQMTCAMWVEIACAPMGHRDTKRLLAAVGRAVYRVTHKNEGASARTVYEGDLEQAVNEYNKLDGAI